MGFLTNQSTKQNRLVTLVNYDIYQCGDSYLTKQPTNYQQTTNKPLTTWHHGDSADPLKWPKWKFFHLSHNPIGYAPTSGHRFWLYTKSKAHDLDIYFNAS